MTTATKTKIKKQCIDLMRSAWNPKVKGCGKEKILNNKNFKPSKASKDGYRGLCNLCMSKAKPAIEQFKIDNAARIKKKNKRKAAKNKAKSDFGKMPKKKPAKVKAPKEAKPDWAKIPQSEEAAAPKEPPAIPEEDYPKANGSEMVIVAPFNAMYRNKIRNLNRLQKVDSNIIVFLHSVIFNGGADNWATKESVGIDMCRRFRAVVPSTLKGFSYQTFKDGLIERKQDEAGWDSTHNRRIMITTHFKLSDFGITWYNEWIDKTGLPDPVIPIECKILINKGSGDRTEMSEAFRDAENGKSLQEIMINFIQDYRKKHKLTITEMAQKIGMKTGGSLSSAYYQNRIPKKYRENVKQLMILNKAMPTAEAPAAPEAAPVIAEEEEETIAKVAVEAIETIAAAALAPAPNANLLELSQQATAETLAAKKMLIKSIVKLEKVNAKMYELSLRQNLLKQEIEILNRKANI